VPIPVGSSDEREPVDLDDYFRGIDDLLAAEKLHGSAHRVRELDELRGASDYSALYTMNQLDVHSIVGCTPISGYFVANGFSGHGFKMAPAIGALIAQAAAGVACHSDPDIGPDFLAFSRDPISLTSKSVLAWTRRFTRKIHLRPPTTLIDSTPSNGIAGAFVRTIKRDHVRAGLHSQRRT